MIDNNLCFKAEACALKVDIEKYLYDRITKFEDKTGFPLSSLSVTLYVGKEYVASGESKRGATALAWVSAELTFKVTEEMGL